MHIKFQSEINTYMYSVCSEGLLPTNNKRSLINEHKTLTLHATDKRKEGGRGGRGGRKEGEKERREEGRRENGGNELMCMYKQAFLVVTLQNGNHTHTHTHVITIPNNAHLGVGLCIVLFPAKAKDTSGLDKDSFLLTLLVTTGVTVKAGLVTTGGVPATVDTAGGDAVVGVAREAELRCVGVSLGFGLKLSFLML